MPNYSIGAHVLPIFIKSKRKIKAICLLIKKIIFIYDNEFIFIAIVIYFQ